MTKERPLEARRAYADNLELTIANADRDIEEALRALPSSPEPGRLIAYIRDRQTDQLDMMKELGRTEAEIEIFEQHDRNEQEASREAEALTRLDERGLGQPEDHLDWFRQSLDEKPARVHEIELAREEMLRDLERDEPDDQLDWFRER